MTANADRAGLRLAVIGPIVMIAVVLGILAYVGAVETENLQAQAITLRAELDENAAEIVTLNERVMSLNGRLERLTEAATMETLASHYGGKHNGRLTASGIPFDENELTAASPWLPFGSRWRVTRIDTGASVVVMITDRGPAMRLGRGLDLSTAAARALGMLKRGVVRVKIQPEG